MDRNQISAEDETHITKGKKLLDKHHNNAFNKFVGTLFKKQHYVPSEQLIEHAINDYQYSQKFLSRLLKKMGIIDEEVSHRNSEITLDIIRDLMAKEEVLFSQRANNHPRSQDNKHNNEAQDNLINFRLGN